MLQKTGREITAISNGFETIDPESCQHQEVFIETKRHYEAINRAIDVSKIHKIIAVKCDENMFVANFC